MGQLQRVYRLLHALSHAERAVEAGLGQQAAELFAAITRQHIGRPVQAGLERKGDFAQAVVAARWP